MEVTRQEFAKVLQDNEARIYWSSGKDAPAGVVVHEWRLTENDRIIATELQADSYSMYWVRSTILK